MFWKFAPTTSNIDSLLEKEDVTLRELLNEDDVLQECKGQNTKLIEFLCKKEVIEDLVEMVTVEPGEEEDESIRYKYPNLACELLTSDVSQINDALGDSEVIRKKLFSFLDKEPPVNPLLASFFSKVVGILLSRKPEPTLEYIKAQDDFLASVLKHLGTSAIMDLLLRMVTCVEAADLRAQVLSWLNDNQLVQRLIGIIDPAYDEELHCNSAQSLCDIIRLSREHMYTMQESAQEDPLLYTLEREETVSLLLHHMFDGEILESVIVNGISVLLALLEIRRPAPFGFPDMAPELTQLDVERLARGVSRTLHGVSGRLADFHKLLLEPPKHEIMKCTFGELDPPLGNTRLHVGKLLSAILMTNTHNINSQLADLKIFDSLLDLFFQYEYNNFLHTQVAGCIQTVLGNAANVSSQHQKPETTPPGTDGSSQSDSNKQDEEESETENPRLVAPLLAHLFEECRIIQRIMDAWEDNHRHENEDKGHRKGNMGHLTLITNYIVENLEKGTNCERLKRFVSEMPEEDQGRWQKFVAETLSEMNEKNTKELGGHNPMHFSSDEEGDSDFRDVPFNTDSSLQQAYTDYQLQQMTSNFIDQFGFTDEDFAEPDDNMKFDKIESIEFDLKGDTNSSAQLFEAVCKARVGSLDDTFRNDDDAPNSDKSEGSDIWEERPIQFADDVQGSPRSKTISTTPTVTVRRRSDSDSSTGSSSSGGSADDSPIGTPARLAEGEEMDTSQSPGWKASFEGYEGPNSSSNNSTPTTSPRQDAAPTKQRTTDSEHPMDIGQELKAEEVVISSSANAEDNWADFGKFQSNTVSITAAADDEPTSSDRSSAYSAADSTSKDSVLENLDAGSPMAVTYNQQSPGEPSDGPSASAIVEMQQTEGAVSSSEPPSTSPKDPETGPAQDVDMDDVSSTPDFQLVETEVRSSLSPTNEADSQASRELSASSAEPSSSVAMDTEPSSTDESEVKRQRIEIREQGAVAEGVSSGSDDSREVQSVIIRSEAADDSPTSGDCGDSDRVSSSSINVAVPTAENRQSEANTAASVSEAVARSRSDGRGGAPGDVVPDTSTIKTDADTSVPGPQPPNPPQSSEATVAASESASSDYVQHNEVSSSSAVEAKLANSLPAGGPADVNPPAEMKANGPV